ncbi:MAG: DUF4377 domain-containing protein [Geminicoccaceae bacterium]|nr:DUF4377 domain-containing protein [Geminicoccaceae bacterium]MCB9943677.1 DUF4377 domain-containing protein [Geminicoccaceae bacterium]
MFGKWLWMTAAAMTITSCSALSGDDSFWVDSFKVPCAGVGKMQCLQVQENEIIDPEAWQLFYDPIDGFEFETGTFQRIRVEKEVLDPATVPADASSIRYKLVEVLDRQHDPRIAINDIWVLRSLDGAEATADDFSEAPVLEFSLTEMTVRGHDGCNQLHGRIEELTAVEIRLGPVAATRRACIKGEGPARFDQALSKVRAYTLKERTLTLSDEDGGHQLVLTKVD